ncbi:MAG: Ig-like domain-containing protein, partial [Deltaproteobacteria bacterium]|nr:Ig-like domain-containing protein [Deltaproteobacteria bacterium]
GTATGGLTVGSVTNTSGNTYQVALSGAPVDGALSLAISNVEDLVGNPLGSHDISYTLDVTAPQVTAISPADGEVLGGLFTIEVTYSETVSASAQTASSYSLSGAGAAGLSIANINKAGNTYTLNLTGTQNDGAVQFTVLASTISDTAGNTIAADESRSYTIDRINPTGSITPVYDTVINTLSSIVVSFSEPVTGWDVLANYSISGNSKGDLAVDSITDLGGNEYQVNFSGDVSETTSKEVLFSITNIEDMVGNTFYLFHHRLLVDQTAPAISSYLPTPGPVRTSLSTVEITFDDAVVGGEDPANYVLSGTGTEGGSTLAVANASNTSGNTYQLTLTGDPVQGTITITPVVSDAVGNQLSGSISYEYQPPATVTTITSAITMNMVSMATDGSKILAVSNNNSRIYESSNGGGTWFEVLHNCGIGTKIIYAGGKWVLGGINSGTYTSVCVSPNGATGNWTKYSASAVDTSTIKFYGITHDGSKYVAVGRDSTGTGRDDQCIHATSTDAITWNAHVLCLSNTELPLKVHTWPNDIFWINGGFYITGTSYLLGPAVSYKADVTEGITYWAPQGSGLTSAYDMDFDGANVLAGGSCCDSTGSRASISKFDGVSWSTYSVPETSSMVYDVAYHTSGGYIAVGKGGLILTSADALTWVRQPVVTSFDLKAVFWDVPSGHWLITGNSGIILTVVP